ncbi:MAG TPA: ABC transporter permease [Longimicrobiales bacterium]|nr:ABC transporter permease [Longimicrobiales bacterium]
MTATETPTAPSAAARDGSPTGGAHPGADGGPPLSSAADGRSGFFATLREIATDAWQYRQLTFQLALRDVRIRYKQAVMGFAWAILMPALVVLAGALVRYAMAYVAGTEVDSGAISGMAVKAVPWAFFVGAIGFATTSLTGNAQLVGKVYFPREALPLAAVLAQSFDSTVGTVALLLALPLMGVAYTLGGILWVPPLAALLFTFTLGTALILGCANLFFRDVKYIVQVLLTFGIFFTPVFFEPAMFGPLGAQVMMLNPLAPMLEGLRLALVEGHDLLEPLVQASRSGAEVITWRPAYLAYAAGVAVTTLVGGALIFHRFEFVFAEYV